MALPNKLFRNDTFIGFALALTAFAVYLATLSPSLAGEEDQGELAAAAYVLGNTHPTGYPLFTMLGRVFSMLPLGDLRVIVKLNLMTALFCAAAALVFYHLILLLLRDGVPGKQGLDKAVGKTFAHVATPKPTDGALRAAAAAATLTFAFSETYWANALNLEVYGLHLFALALTTLLFLRAMHHAEHGGRADAPIWLLFGYVLGLSFAHHMMTVLLAPAFLWLYISVHGIGKSAWLKALRILPLFALGLSAYLYLPIRASVQPLLNWGDPATFHDFWLHVSGHQYRAMMFSSIDVPFSKFTIWAERFPGLFGFVPLLFAAWGVWALMCRDRPLLVFSALLFFGCLLYAINYDFDDPNFYLQLCFVTALWVGYGLLSLIRAVRRFDGNGSGKTFWARAALGASLLVPVFPFAAHYRALNDSGNYATEDFAKNVLGPLDQGAVLLTNQSQFISSAALYLQTVEGYRPDIIVIQESATGFRSYLRQLQARHPEFSIRHLQQGLAGSSGLDDSTAFVQRYRNTVWPLVDKRSDISIYFAPDINMPRFFGDVASVPQGLVLKSYSLTPPPLAPPRTFTYRPFSKESPSITGIRTYYATAYVNQALLYGHLNDTAVVLDMLHKALAVKPGHTDAARMLRWVQQGY